MGFQEDLRNSIINADPKLDREQLLSDIFKSFVAKLFEHVLQKDNRLPFDAMVEVKRNLINEFKTASLDEYQQSMQWYDDLFEKTVKEILESAALAHQGVDLVTRAPQNFEVNPSGLYIPK